MYAGFDPRLRETIDGAAAAAPATAAVGDAVGSWVVLTPSESPRTVRRASGRMALTRIATAQGADSRAPMSFVLRCHPSRRAPADWGRPEVHAIRGEGEPDMCTRVAMPIRRYTRRLYVATLVAGRVSATVWRQ
jgi:hypothetical protein